MPSEPEIDRLLDRPAAERLREHRYRFAQVVIFGMPVLALHWLGRDLGGRDAERWAGPLQALLAGWALYVGAAGMLCEGLVCRRRRGRIMPDFLAALPPVGLYAASLLSVLHLLFTGRLWFDPLCFHWSMILLAAWTGLRWRQLSGLQHPESDSLTTKQTPSPRRHEVTKKINTAKPRPTPARDNMR